jgi:hypothetical protein
MENQDRNIILDIVEKINQEIQEEVEEGIDDFGLEFISNGCHSIILFLGIEIWNGDVINDKWIGYQDPREFQESFMDFIWAKIKYIKEILCKVTQYREREFHFKPSI